MSWFSLSTLYFKTFDWSLTTRIKQWEKKRLLSVEQAFLTNFKFYFHFSFSPWRRFVFKPKYWAICLNIYVFLFYFFCLLLHRFAVRINLPFHIFVERDEVRAPLKTPAWEAKLYPATSYAHLCCTSHLLDLLAAAAYLINFEYTRLWQHYFSLFLVFTWRLWLFCRLHMGHR